MTLTLLALLSGMLLMGGLLLIANAFRTPQPALHSALASLSGQASTMETPGLDLAPSGMIGRLGRWLLIRTPLQPNPRQRALLRLRGMDLADYYGYRLFYAIFFACLPWLVQIVFLLLKLPMPGAIPAVLTVTLAALGWFLPAAMLSRDQQAVTDDSYDAFIVLLDLVVLQRMADKSAIDAITNAAFVSEAPLFKQIQLALNRSVLENVPPWAGLRLLADEIQLPELSALVNICLLQDQGASLVDSLRAQANELRNEALLRIRQEATQITERMVFPKLLQTSSVIMLLFGAVLLNIILQGGASI